MAEQSVRILSLLVGAILATFGLIKNDLLLIIPAIIISPIGDVLNDISYNIVHHNLKEVLFNLGILLFMSIVSFLIGLRFGKYSKKIDKDQIRTFEQWKDIKWLHLGIGVMLGMFTAYLVSVSVNTNSIIPQMIGIGIAITLLPPIVDMGLRLSQEHLDNSYIWNDLKIVLGNITSFVIGAGIVYYGFAKYKK